jgi:HPt (histidine-containing phosphotransfer) domain-containing protein
MAGKGAGMAHQQADSLLLESFIRDARKVISALEELNQKDGWAEDEEGLRTFTVMVHGIKSSLRNVGEVALSESAYKLETAGREKDIGAVAASVPLFLNDLRVFLEKIEPPRGNEEGADEDIEELYGKLQAISEMCADYSRKGILDLIAGMESRSKKTEEVLDSVKAYVIHSDFDKADDAVSAYASELSCADFEDRELDWAGKIFLKNEVAGLDIAKGLDRYDSDGETYLKILRSYTVGVSSMLNAMEAAGAEGLDDYERAAHSIKGASRGIFAVQIAKDAEGLEDAAENSDLNYINARNRAFIECVRKLVADIEEMIAVVDAENPKPRKDKPDGELLSRLLAACKVYSVDGVDAAISEIERYQYTSDGGLANGLRECADRMDFAKIIEKLSSLDW